MGLCIRRGASISPSVLLVQQKRHTHTQGKRVKEELGEGFRMFLCAVPRPEQAGLAEATGQGSSPRLGREAEGQSRGPKSPWTWRLPVLALSGWVAHPLLCPSRQGWPIVTQPQGGQLPVPGAKESEGT